MTESEKKSPPSIAITRLQMYAWASIIQLLYHNLINVTDTVVFAKFDDVESANQNVSNKHVRLKKIFTPSMLLVK